MEPRPPLLLPPAQAGLGEEGGRPRGGGGAGSGGGGVASVVSEGGSGGGGGSGVAKNNGIPMFIQERLEERHRRRTDAEVWTHVYTYLRTCIHTYNSAKGAKRPKLTHR